MSFPYIELNTNTVGLWGVEERLSVFVKEDNKPTVEVNMSWETETKTSFEVIGDAAVFTGIFDPAHLLMCVLRTIITKHTELGDAVELYGDVFDHYSELKLLI